MKGFEINYKGGGLKVAIENGMITIDIYTIRGNKNNDTIYTGGIDYDKSQENVWLDFLPIRPEEHLQIKVTDVDKVSTPARTKKVQNIKPATKLETFRRLEEELAKQGLL